MKTPTNTNIPKTFQPPARPGATPAPRPPFAGTRRARTLPIRLAVLILLALPLWHGSSLAQPADAGIDWQPVGSFDIARSETTVGQFRRFVQATGLVTRAERQGGGEVYEAGWVRKTGWTWRTPFGGSQAAADDEPAVHLSHDEAHAATRLRTRQDLPLPEWRFTRRRDVPGRLRAASQAARHPPWCATVAR
jgi:Sulfatase-modifying factor enzyme 1